MNEKKLLVYLSSGGTCRDPMAMAITEQILQVKAPDTNVRVVGGALIVLSNNEVSYSARNAIKALYGEDLLAKYAPKLVTSELLEKADLVLVMDEELMSSCKNDLPDAKTHLFKKYFGFEGDVIDPWPDRRDSESLRKYKATANEIKSTIEYGIDKLIKALEV